MKIITHIEYENKKILTETDVDFLEFENKFLLAHQAHLKTPNALNGKNK